MRKHLILMVAGLSFAAAAKGGADLVVYGKVFTSEGDKIVEAFAVKDGRYVYVGDKAGAEAYVEDGKTEVVDYTDRGLVMPGCGNGHAHYIPGLAIQSVGTAMSPATDVEKFFAEVVPAAVKKARETGAKGVLGNGWDAMKFPQNVPYRQRLDAICSDLPIYFADEEGHKGLANTILLKSAGIIKEDGSAGKTEIRGGEVVLDADGIPTGYLKEQAGNCARSFMDNDSLFTVDMAKESMDKVQEKALSEGYTMYLDGGSTYFYNDNIYKAAKQMDEAGDMHIVLGLAYVAQSWMDVDQTLADACDAQKYESAHVKPNWLKLLVDGTVENGTGLIEPLYTDGHQGIPNWTEEELTDITRKANDNGMTMHVHALGNKAVNWTVNAFINGGKDEMRNTLVHVYNVDQPDYQRIADHNIYVTEGLLWHHASTDLQADLMQTLPEGLNNRGYPMKSWFDYGINVSSHSDFPALSDSPDDPFGIMEIAVTGVYWAENAKPWWPEELITREQALAALTINVARQMSIEDERGSVSVGKYADFLLVDKDVLICPVTEIHTAKPAATYFEGKKVFSIYELKEKIDYSNTNNWMKLPEITKDVDTFYVYPTDYADDSEDASVFADINDESLRTAWSQTYMLQGTAYEESSNVFAPYYRQMNMVAMVRLPPKERSEALGNVARTDVFAALDYYFENLNGGRSFVLAAHSQGSVMLRFVLAEYMAMHPEYLERMVAAYVLGYSITKEYLAENPHLKFAEKENDTGVIVSWNTEGPENEGKENLVLLPNAISINPLNWKRDATYASEKENLGGYMYNPEIGKVELVPEAADAQLNLERGVVITTNSKMAPHEAVDAFGPASYHDGDYCLYFNNIKANVAKRIAAYMFKHFVVINEEDITDAYAAPKATTLQGVAYDDGGEVVGIVELKLGKVNTKKKTSKVSGSFTGLDGKKITLTAANVTGIDGTAPATVSMDVKGIGTMTVTISGTQFAGSLNGWHVQSGTVGGDLAKNAVTVSVDADDVSMFAGTVLTDLLPDSEQANVVRGKWVFNKATTVRWAKPKKDAEHTKFYDNVSDKDLIVDETKNKTNGSGLKLTYTSKNGTFKGAFKVYALEGVGKATKLKKYTINVTGVVVNGVGYGVATCKKPAVSWTVTVE